MVRVGPDELREVPGGVAEDELLARSGVVLYLLVPCVHRLLARHPRLVLGAHPLIDVLPDVLESGHVPAAQLLVAFLGHFLRSHSSLRVRLVVPVEALVCPPLRHHRQVGVPPDLLHVGRRVGQLGLLPVGDLGPSSGQSKLIMNAINKSSFVPLTTFLFSLCSLTISSISAAVNPSP